MDRARLAGKTRTKAREHRQHCRERLAEAPGRIAIVIARRDVLGKRDRVRNLVGAPVEARRQVMRVEHRDQPLVQRGDAAGVERQLLARFVADPQHDGVTAEVESQREGPIAARRRWQGRKAASVGLQRDVPAVVDPRRIGDADLAQHLRGEVQHRQGLVVVLNGQLGPVAHLIPAFAFCAAALLEPGR